MGAMAKTQRRKSAQEARRFVRDSHRNERWHGPPALGDRRDLVDIIDGGCGLELKTPLQSATLPVVVRGKLGENCAGDHHLKPVCDGASEKTDGTFTAPVWNFQIANTLTRSISIRWIVMR